MAMRTRLLSNLAFVPAHKPPTVGDIQNLQHFMDSVSRLLVITGAGVSTESGIPDYRSEGVGLYARSTYRPMKIQEFLSSRKAQRRYWARNYFGWPRFSALRPNLTHKVIKSWQDAGKLSGLVTQNVDGLHQKAGSTGVIELHGTGHVVGCVKCTFTIDRELFQNLLVDLNRHLPVQVELEEDPDPDEAKIRPDGDVHLVESVVKEFILPNCPHCGDQGILKPAIVFFGDNVPKPTVEAIFEIVDKSDGLLVLGSSLQTYSAYRYILATNNMNNPIGIVNLGPTRADSVADFKIKCRVGEILPLVRVQS